MTQTPAPVTSKAPATTPDEDPTIGKLAVDVSRNVSLLVRKEIELAKSELSFSARFSGLGVAFFAGAAFIGLLAVIILSVAVAYLIHLSGLNLAWCYLIVFAFYVLVAAVLALLGMRSINKVRRQKLRSVAELKKTTEALKHRSS